MLLKLEDMVEFVIVNREPLDVDENWNLNMKIENLGEPYTFPTEVRTLFQGRL